MTDVNRAAMLQEAREEVARADGKASMLLSALAVVIGVVAAAILAGSWHPSDLSAAWEAVWWAGAAIAAAGSVVLSMAVYPRLTHKLAGEAVTYFNDIALLPNHQALDAALKQQTEEERLLTQLYVVSKIARRKYRFITGSMRLLGLALALILLASIAGH